MAHEIAHYRPNAITEARRGRYVVAGIAGGMMCALFGIINLLAANWGTRTILVASMIVAIYSIVNNVLAGTHAWNKLTPQQRATMDEFYALPDYAQVGIGFMPTVANVKNLTDDDCAVIRNKVRVYADLMERENRNNGGTPEASVLVEALDAAIEPLTDNQLALGAEVSAPLVTETKYGREKHDFSGSTTCRKCGEQMIKALDGKTCPVIQEEMIATSYKPKRPKRTSLGYS